MGRKRLKANLYDLYNNDIAYFHFSRIKNNVGVLGWRYTLEKELSQSQKDFLLQFKNVTISSCYYKYSPSIIHDVIILWDKAIN